MGVKSRSSKVFRHLSDLAFRSLVLLKDYGTCAAKTLRQRHQNRGSQEALAPSLFKAGMATPSHFLFALRASDGGGEE